MWGSRRQGRPAIVGLTVCALLVTGCATCRVPRIDPSGERLFVWDDAPATPAAIAPVAGAASPGPIVYAPVPAAAPIPNRSVLGTSARGNAMGLVLEPGSAVAAVGSQVVLRAGVVGPDQYLRTNQRIEWLIDPMSVGYIVDLNRRTFSDWLVLDGNFPERVSNNYAIASTSRQSVLLTMGTPDPADDVTVLRGQAWLSVSSPIEGTSYVTAIAPCLESWEIRQRTTVIHWIDAQWCFPSPMINPAGSHATLTTAVSRLTSPSPCVGWIVRYQIIDGPVAGFAPEGATVADVPTNAAGQAPVEIFQKQPAAGTNRISIQVIRPTEATAGRSPTLVVGSGSTLCTWSAPGLGVRMRGPSVASVGATATFQIEVSNTGDLPSEDVNVVGALPPGLALIASNPAGQAAGSTVRWALGRLGPADTRQIEVNCRVEREGSLNICAEATARNGLSGRDCLTMAASVGMAPPSLPPAPASVEVKIHGDKQAEVGQEVVFEIEITNRGQQPLSGLTIKDRFDPGLKHAETPSSVIERELGTTLAPGQSQRIGVALQVIRPGRHCQTVEIRDSRRNVLAIAEACVTAVDRSGATGRPRPQPSEPSPAAPAKPAPSPGVSPSRPATDTGRPTPPPSDATRPPVSSAAVLLKVTGPTSREVGETAQFTIEVTNRSSQPLANLKVTAWTDKALTITRVSGGFDRREDTFMWTIKSLAPSGTMQYLIEVRAVTAADEACLHATVGDARATLAQEQACVQIRPNPITTPGASLPTRPAEPTAPGGLETPSLTLNVHDSHDPTTVGKESTYDIEVTNHGTRTERNIVLQVSVPPEMMLVRLQTRGPSSYSVQGQRIQFNPVPALEPGRTLSYRVRVLARQEGVAFFRAEVNSQGLAQPVLTEQKTKINAQ